MKLSSELAQADAPAVTMDSAKFLALLLAEASKTGAERWTVQPLS
ncbi:hypothetical protein NZK35_33485 [Stieleria sp. ICT_E10.1]|nr:hypothetical protein [Stieleria sedimenti]MCS7471588.1 hypothetical protein [Stieleria sedimenti]